MKKILWYSDFLVNTGFGNVSENIIERIMDNFAIESLAVNWFGEPQNKKDSIYYKFRNIPVVQAKNQFDPFGRSKFINILIKENYDTVFILQDLFNLTEITEELKCIKAKKNFKYVLYAPLDSTVKQSWRDVIKTADVPVVYTNWAKKQLNMDCRVIYHGVDKSFLKLSRQNILNFKNEYFGIKDQDILITNVNRNQQRKDLTKTIAAFDIFHKNTNQNSYLYLHCNWKDESGIDLSDFIKTYYPDLIERIIRPKRPLTKDGLNYVYNASDLVVSSTLGEGWGLSTTEAMACGVPVLIPDNTTAREILGEGERGYLCKCGNNQSLMVSLNFDNNLLRPAVDVQDMAEKMELILNSKKEVGQKVCSAIKWVNENCNWDKIAKEWSDLL